MKLRQHKKRLRRTEINGKNDEAGRKKTGRIERHLVSDVVDPIYLIAGHRFSSYELYLKNHDCKYRAKRKYSHTKLKIVYIKNCYNFM